jgi:hypothetical protein
MNPWRIVTKFDRQACAIADRHYSRRKPGSSQFMPPGQTRARDRTDFTLLGCGSDGAGRYGKGEGEAEAMTTEDVRDVKNRRAEVTEEIARRLRLPNPDADVLEMAAEDLEQYAREMRAQAEIPAPEIQSHLDADGNPTPPAPAAAR